VTGPIFPSPISRPSIITTCFKGECVSNTETIGCANNGNLSNPRVKWKHENFAKPNHFINYNGVTKGKLDAIHY
jgi:hypothetical protein